MSCDVGEVMKRFGECEEPVTQEKRKKGWRMSCDIGEATEGLKNEL